MYSNILKKVKIHCISQNSDTLNTGNKSESVPKTDWFFYDRTIGRSIGSHVPLDEFQYIVIREEMHHFLNVKNPLSYISECQPAIRDLSRSRIYGCDRLFLKPLKLFFLKITEFCLGYKISFPFKIAVRISKMWWCEVQIGADRFEIGWQRIKGIFMVLWYCTIKIAYEKLSLFITSVRHSTEIRACNLERKQWRKSLHTFPYPLRVNDWNFISRAFVILIVGNFICVMRGSLPCLPNVFHSLLSSTETSYFTSWLWVGDVWNLAPT